jgi:Antitoxin FitA-like, ribbon-helix-helix
MRIRGVDDEIEDALKRSAEANGRSLEAELRYRLEEFGRARTSDFPTAMDWINAGFDDVLELVPGLQYLVSANLQCAGRPVRAYGLRPISQVAYRICATEFV